MLKPTVFLSHSSTDKAYIKKVKEILSTRTSKTVDFFQSSDGESIPFGNNWVHKIEENLNKAKIMFVFISPKSVTSSWIYFESGFAYSKGINVIPVGICGVDIGQMKPPLNLLQGFNISNEDGLGNLITILNRIFETDFNKKFEEADYSELFLIDQESPEANLATINNIDQITINLQGKNGDSFAIHHDKDDAVIYSDAILKLHEVLESIGIKNTFKEGSQPFGSPRLSSHGLLINQSKQDQSILIQVKIDPQSLSYLEGFINKINHTIYAKNAPSKGWVSVTFNGNVQILTNELKASARFHKGEHELHEIKGGWYNCEGWAVKTLGKNGNGFGSIDKDHAHVVFENGNFDSNKLFKILNRLNEIEIIKIN